MCGRYALGMPRPQIRALPGYPRLAVGEWVNEDNFVPRYNIAPSTHAPVIRRRHASDPESSELILQTMRWGIQYGKDGSKGSQAINARSENLVQGVGMWNKLRGKNRCIVVCQGYYEWQTKGKDKLPHFTKHSDGRVMLMAGLYESVVEKEGAKPTYTFVVVTTDASKSMSWLHDRQPVILSSTEDIQRWLDTSSKTWSSDLARLLHPWEDTKSPIQCYQVPKEIGKVGSESATFIEPVAERKDGIQAMFARQRSKQAETSCEAQA
ncbi:hypothetical protein F5I97DRAFT_421966 [Phlebopus sp. FC_14]|nr:hypothetical protein F5I97DRAFT_421966 [Phlebopus sp. FC_14]